MIGSEKNGAHTPGSHSLQPREKDESQMPIVLGKRGMLGSRHPGKGSLGLPNDMRREREGLPSAGEWDFG